jgi:hypothetical protein
VRSRSGVREAAGEAREVWAREAIQEKDYLNNEGLYVIFISFITIMYF